MATAVLDRTSEASKTFHPEQLTNAPLRLVMHAPVKASREEALKAILDLKGIRKYLSSIKHVDLEHQQGGPQMRICNVAGMGNLREEIVWYDEEQGYAYAAQPLASLPLKDHLGVARVIEAEDGETTVRWEQRFNWKGVFKPMMMKMMFPRMMRELGRGIQNELGAAGTVKATWL